MQYRQSGRNPFEGGADGRPFQPAQHARAGEHDEFRYAVRTNRKKKQTLGHYTSTIMQVGLPYHSSLELSAMQWLDLQPSVRAYWSQPLKFAYEMEGEERHYTPDIGVQLADGQNFMLEVKPRADANSEKNRRRWQEIAPVLKRDGYFFAFLLDDFLQSQPLAGYLRAIQRFRDAVFDPLRVFELQTRLDRDRPWTIAELLPVMATYGFTAQELFPLVRSRHLYLNLRRTISGTSYVWLPSRAPQKAIWIQYNAA